MKINVLKFPQRTVIGYLIITFVMYLISPWNWEKENILALIMFNGVIFGSILFGFKRGLKAKFFKRRIFYGNFVNKGYWNLLLFISILYIYPNFLVRFQVDSISINDIIFRLGVALTDISDAYFLKNESELKNTSIFSNIWILIYTFLSPVVYFVKFVSIYHWKRLHFLQKCIVGFVIFCDILAFLCIGTNKGVFDYILNIPFLFVLLILQKDNTFFVRFSMKRLVILIGFLIIGIYFFGSTFQSRTKNKSMVYNTINNKPINYGESFISMLPENMIRGYLGLDFYLTHGYNGLDKAFDLEYKPTYGFGNSPLLATILTKLGFYYNTKGITYEERIDKIYNAKNGQYWHTAYVAFANDISFYGVPFLVFFMSYFFGKAWKDIVLNKNVIALPLITLFVIMFFYLGANNQVLGKGQLFNFIALFIFWNFYSTKNLTD